jgi:hypothetical protein
MMAQNINARTWTQRECGYTRAKLQCNRRGAYTEIPTSPVVEEETPFLSHINGLGTNKRLVMGRDGARNQEDCWPGPPVLTGTGTGTGTVGL